MSVRVKKFFSLLKDPALWMFISIAAVMWYLNHLNAIYMNDINVPIKVRGMAGVDKSNPDGSFDVVCQVRANGYTLMLMNLFPSYAALELSAADLTVSIDPTDSSYYSINLRSLERAISSQIKGVELIGVLNNEVRIRSDKYAEKIVPLKPIIKFDQNGQYMQLGPTVLEPSAIVIKGPVKNVAAIDYVETMPLVVGLDKHDYVGIVPLQEPKGVETSVHEVRYNVDIDRFTEYKRIKKVAVRGASGDFIVLPESVTVKYNVAVSRIFKIENEELKAYIDYDRSNIKGDDGYLGDNRFLVKLDGLFNGIGQIDISPRYVTVLKESDQK